MDGSILIIVFELSVNLFESYLMVEFISKYNGYKFYGIKRNILFGGTVIAIFLNVTAMNYVQSYVESANYISLIIIVSYSLYALNGKNKIKIFSCIVFNVLMILTAMISLLSISTIFIVDIKYIITTFSVYRLTAAILSKILLFYLSRIIIKIRVNQYEKSSNLSWFAVTLIPVLTIFIMVTITESVLVNKDPRISFYFLLSMIGLIIINAFSYFMFTKLGEEHKKNLENTIINQRYILSQKHNDEVKELYNEIKIIKHDMKNHLINIREYINNNYMKEGTEYIDKIIEKINVTKKFVLTKNVSFDAIVNNKFSKAYSMGIKTIISVKYEIDDEIEGTDINVLIGNLLDNSIEACENIKGKKEISLLTDKRKDYILIEVSNTIDKAVLKENGQLVTTKKDKENHGMGIKSVRKIVEKYNGIMDFKEDKNNFTCKILLLSNHDQEYD
ncbi:GHKL domain-containing protein [Sedimentibacter hydroxybenzoicus DSM 7310]|uniref:GHKL domain-containing protein n=1 Tax=Sedimentibacter hydroxybenzoicus DSM 7310 TaxID=1123245 RepID=A0A974BLH4_SEDHY|nr:sensor histidine kinase [Sedimentibacter hydroxybenzoicus]NYB75555.1 GHKL domain-containing protein [Sedimentibacter hydroxybenzoicus DSM 7310]